MRWWRPVVSRSARSRACPGWTNVRQLGSQVVSLRSRADLDSSTKTILETFYHVESLVKFYFKRLQVILFLIAGLKLVNSNKHSGKISIVTKGLSVLSFAQGAVEIRDTGVEHSVSEKLEALTFINQWCDARCKSLAKVRANRSTYLTRRWFNLGFKSSGYCRAN